MDRDDQTLGHGISTLLVQKVSNDLCILHLQVDLVYTLSLLAEDNLAYFCHLVSNERVKHILCGSTTTGVYIAAMLHLLLYACAVGYTAMHCGTFIIS